MKESAPRTEGALSFGFIHFPRCTHSSSAFLELVSTAHFTRALMHNHINGNIVSF
jgi:hypothetical protein